MKDNHVYLVTAYRWGEAENHSYPVGVFTKKHKALEAAVGEEEWRGGKYGCEVVEIPVNGDYKNIAYRLVRKVYGE